MGYKQLEEIHLQFKKLSKEMHDLKVQYLELKGTNVDEETANVSELVRYILSNNYMAQHYPTLLVKVLLKLESRSKYEKI